MNDIKISGTVFNPTKRGNNTTFRLSFSNGKDLEGNYKKNGQIDCRTTKLTELENVSLREFEQVVVTGFLSCDRWTYQGKNYQSLVVIAQHIEKKNKNDIPF